ncbi:xyloside xylosyltransferase 1 isoform X2 [Coccinella septempunctata]|nr:xyloside xylosyltransferase 1 isoform X2 [Coccinella septempunctata]
MQVIVRRPHKVFLILTGILVIFYYVYTNASVINNRRERLEKENSTSPDYINEEYNVWLIFTKVYNGSPLTYKFKELLDNLMTISTVPLNFNIIVDNSSQRMAENFILKQMSKSDKNISYTFYNIISSAKLVEDIVDVMSNFFSKPGSYYNDVLFYISLGLHRIAPASQKYAILLDCDIYFKKDITLLFDQFKRF